ncbi:hypothetical protein NUSPORA_00375 [Nucleospora cyclopteri]
MFVLYFCMLFSIMIYNWNTKILLGYTNNTTKSNGIFITYLSGIFYFFLLSSQSLLDDSVVPILYNISIKVKPDTFEGFVEIKLQAKKQVTCFNINSKHLNISKINILYNKKQIDCDFKKKKLNLIEINLPETIEGEFVLIFNYSSLYKDKKGFFKTKYYEDDVFATFFEPNYACTAFPCFDQPDMKATLILEISCPSDYLALSNQEVVSVTEELGIKTYKFAETSKMSTYIVAWAVGKFEFIEISDGSVKIRFYAHKLDVEFGRFALEIGYECLKFYENYFNIKYPFKKLDLISIPYCEFLGMENWGIIIFNSLDVLYNPETTCLKNQKKIAELVCHEIAHMWFGNLVTLKWWNDLWLNEGFATYASFLALSNLMQIEWDVEADFIYNNVELALLVDSTTDSYKLRVNINDPSDISYYNTFIWYSKGASILRMIENWIGDNFKKGVIKYLNENMYSNVTTIDLCRNLDEFYEGEIVIEDLLDCWTNTAGFPYITVEECGDNIILTQNIFTTNEVTEDKIWKIPLLIRWFGEKEKVDRILMTEKTMEIPMRSKIYKINDDFNCFIRVQYPQNVLENLLLLQNLSKINFYNLISDAISLAFFFKANYPFKLLKTCRSKFSFEVLFLIIKSTDSLKSCFYDKPEIFNFVVKFQNELIEPFLSQIDILNPSLDPNVLECESLIVLTAVMNGIYKIETSEIHKEFKSAYFYTLATSNIYGLKEICMSSTMLSERELAMTFIGLTQDQVSYEICMKDYKFLNNREIILYFDSFASNYKYRHLFAKYVINNFDDIEDSFNSIFLIDSFTTLSLFRIYNEDEKECVLEFLNELEIESENNDYACIINNVRNKLNKKQALRDGMLNDLIQLAAS